VIHCIPCSLPVIEFASSVFMDMVFLCAPCCHLGSGWGCLFLSFALLYDHVPIVAGLHVTVVEGDGVDFLWLSSILG
jgi:hypothetical protein